ncbi:MAG: GGDEF domain-containing protein, partial [Pseudohongiella sp.]|nr:GGDEF domain-containing protein [Pseudohongiella sp.]
MMLDMPTLMLVLAALAVSSTLVFLLLWLVNRDMPGVSLLFYSSVLSLLSVITNFLATSIGLPEGLSPFVSNSLSLTGGLLIVEGVMLFRGFVWRYRNLIFYTLVALLMLVSWINRFDAQIRYIFHDGIMVGFGLVTAVMLLWRPVDVDELRANLLAVFGVLMMVLSLGGRGAMAILNPDTVEQGLGSTATQWFMLATVLFYMTWTFGLSIACYSRARHEVLLLAREDSLTGMPNRRSLDERLHLALADAQRNGEGFAVIMIDVNGFKSVNDVLGHRAGDQLLQILGKRLKETLRDVDYAGRLGGDEFLVIVRGALALQGIDALIVRLKETLE